jgi:hypothetical protein
LDSGDADLDLWCAEKTKVFVQGQGKGFYSQLIVEIKKIKLKSIAIDTFDFPH